MFKYISCFMVTHHLTFNTGRIIIAFVKKQKLCANESYINKMNLALSLDYYKPYILKITKTICSLT